MPSQKVSADLLSFENELWKKYKYLAGLDEAGRGAWAGPVAAAAVVFEPGVTIAGVKDSKLISPKKREVLFEEIKEKSLAYGIGLVDPQTIDEVNILEATKQAMLIAIAQLDPKPEFLMIDGNMTIDSEISQKAIIDGDALSFTIAAASILAKVTRDQLMVGYAETYPEYAFEKHKGYGTKAHREALESSGVTVIHRKSYAPVAKILNS